MRIHELYEDAVTSPMTKSDHPAYKFWVNAAGGDFINFPESDQHALVAKDYPDTFGIEVAGDERFEYEGEWSDAIMQKMFDRGWVRGAYINRHHQLFLQSTNLANIKKVARRLYGLITPFEVMIDVGDSLTNYEATYSLYNSDEIERFMKFGRLPT
jgi:hypothetical protein